MRGKKSQHETMHGQLSASIATARPNKLETRPGKNLNTPTSNIQPFCCKTPPPSYNLQIQHNTTYRVPSCAPHLANCTPHRQVLNFNFPTYMQLRPAPPHPPCTPKLPSKPLLLTTNLLFLTMQSTTDPALWTLLQHDPRQPQHAANRR